jgi:8-oxo-dGTP pyrophosphatase MutT (NUDIX family)
MHTTESIAKILILNSDNRVLLLTLSEHRTNPKRSFLPDLPGGVVDPGESELDATVRETQEETGIQLDPRNIRLVYARTAHYASEHKSVTKLLYVTTLRETPEVTLSWEHGDYAWMPLDTAAQTMPEASFYSEALKYAIDNELV